MYSDAKNEPHPQFSPEFISNGMFVINAQRIHVSRRRGLNILNYDPVTGNYDFAVNYLKKLSSNNKSVAHCELWSF